MKSYVWLTFGFMGLAYYEMSGGADFVPEQPATLLAEAEAEEAPEIVTRAPSPSLLAVSASNVAQAPSFTDDSMVEAVAEAVSLDTIEQPPAQPVVAEMETPETTLVDIREVAGSRVNMRTGPGTSFDVITTLEGGTALEVLEIDANGWANVATVDRSIEGWMAERLLTDPET